MAEKRRDEAAKVVEELLATGVFHQVVVVREGSVVEAGTPEIDVDERSAMVRRRMREDPEAFTKEMWQRAADFRKNFPRDKRGRG